MLSIIINICLRQDCVWTNFTGIRSIPIFVQQTLSLPSLYILLCLGIVRPFPFLFSLLSPQQQNEIQEFACHFDQMIKYRKFCAWCSALELSTGKRKEYIARGACQSECKKRDVAGKLNILRKSGANSSSRLGATPGRQAGRHVKKTIFLSDYIGRTGKSYNVLKTSPIRCCCFLAKNGGRMVFQCRLAPTTFSIPILFRYYRT